MPPIEPARSFSVILIKLYCSRLDWNCAGFQQLAWLNAANFDPHPDELHCDGSANARIAQDIIDNVSEITSEPFNAFRSVPFLPCVSDTSKIFSTDYRSRCRRLYTSSKPWPSSECR